MAELDRLLYKPFLREKYLNGKHPGFPGHSSRGSRNHGATTKPKVSIHRRTDWGLLSQAQTDLG